MPRKPRRSPGSGTIAYLPDRGVFRARLTVGYLPSGNPRRATRDFSNRREAEDWLIEQRAVHSRGRVHSNMTLAAFIAGWLEEKRLTRAPKTAHDYSYIIKRWVLPELGATPLQRLTTLHVHRWVLGLQRAGARPGIIYRALRYLRFALNSAEDLEVIQHNPARGVKAPAPEHRELTRWSPAEVRRVLDYAKQSGHPLYHYVHLGLTSGLRREELLGLRWQDVDWDNAAIYVRQAITYISGSPLAGPPKTPKSRRTVFLDSETMDILLAQKHHVNEQRQLAGARWQEHDLVFPSSIGTPYPEGNLRKRFTGLCAAAEVTRIRPSDLRSTWASLSEGKIPESVGAARAGHSVQQRRKTYVRSIEEQHREAALGIAELLTLPPLGH